MNTTTHQSPRSIADLVKDLRDETTTLLRQEVELAKTEMSEKASKAGRNIAMAVVGGAIAHLALIFLLLAATGAIDTGVETTDLARHSDWIAPLAVGLIVGGLGAILLMKAKSGLTNINPKPEQTIRSLKEDKQWAQRKVA